VGLIVLGQISVAAENSDPQEGLPKISNLSATSSNAAPALPVQHNSGGAIIPLGNPLWAIPVGSLTATLERPIFDPSRRPAAAKEPAAVPVEETASLPPVSDPPGPPLVLLGAVANERKSVAIFRDQTTKDIVRLKIGDSHSGWTLRRVNGREATFNRGRETSLVQIEIP
jgi:general secretion pathway protein N